MCCTLYFCVRVMIDNSCAVTGMGAGHFAGFTMTPSLKSAVTAWSSQDLEGIRFIPLWKWLLKTNPDQD